MVSSSLFPVEDKSREKADYHKWKMSINLTLEDQGVLDHVRGNIVEPPSNASAAARIKWKVEEVIAKKIIQDLIDKHLVTYISDLNTSKEIYDRLVSLFIVNDANQVLFLRNKLKEIKKGKDESIQAYLFRITEIRNDLLSIGETITDKEMALTTLGGLPYKWYVFRTTLLDNNVIPGFKELMARCIQEETRVEEQEMPMPKGPPATFSSHAKKRNNFGTKSKGKAGPKGGRKGRCYICDKAGHYARECPDRKDSHRDDDQNPSHGNQRNGKFNSKGKRNAGNQERGQPFKKARNSRYESNIVENKQDEYYLPAALSTSAPLDSIGIWLIDSGASRHFTGYKEVLHNLIEKETNLEIILGDNMKYPVKGVGNVSLKLNQGNTIHLKGVLYVPDLKKNLMSISTMENKGYMVIFSNGKVRVWKNNVRDAFTLGFRVDSLYQVDGSLLGVMSCDTSLQRELWHRRFSHLHYKALPDVRQMVTGMPEFRVEKGVCPGCAEGKLKSGPFPSRQSKTSDILQLVHSGISKEPMDPIYSPEPSSSRKRPSWLRGLLDDAKGHAAPRGTFCESKKPNRYQRYLTIMSTIIQNEPSSFLDAVKHQVWKDDMTEEYESITKNDVWEVVPRPQDKTIVTSKWLYKIKHAVDGSTEKYKARFVARGFS
eukprot:PITA_10402